MVQFPGGEAGLWRSPFTTITRCMWYVMVTGPTTGFGDLYPTTDLGKVFGTGACLCSLAVLSFPGNGGVGA